MARQGLELTISVVGLQVNERARRQLRVHREGGRRLVLRREDAGDLGDELAALLARAYRSLRAVRDRGRGRDHGGRRAEPQRGPVPGHDHGRRSALVHARGARGPPRAGVGDGDPAVRVGRRLDVRDGTARRRRRRVAFEQGLLSGGRTATELGRVETQSVRTSGRPTAGNTCSASRSTAATLRTSRSRSSSASSSWLRGRRSGSRARPGAGDADPDADGAAPPTQTPTVEDDSGSPVGSSSPASRSRGVLIGLAAAFILGRRAAT